MFVFSLFLPHIKISWLAAGGVRARGLLRGAEHSAGHRVHGEAVHALHHGVLHTPALEGGQLDQAQWMENEGKRRHVPSVRARLQTPRVE